MDMALLREILLLVLAINAWTVPPSRPSHGVASGRRGARRRCSSK